MRVINGKFIILTELNISDYQLFHKWFIDKEAVKYSLSRWQKRHTLKQIKQWLGETLNDPKVINFGIIEKSSNKLIGYAGICNLSKSSKSGEYFLFIGEKNT